MKYVIDQVIEKEHRQMLSVIRMEIDYELVTLYDAIQSNQQEEIVQSKEKLAKLVEQLIAITG